MDIIEFIYKLSEISHNLDGTCTLVELSRQRGDLEKIMPHIYLLIRKFANQLGSLENTELDLTVNIQEKYGQNL